MGVIGLTKALCDHRSRNESGVLARTLTKAQAQQLLEESGMRNACAAIRATRAGS